MENFPSINLIGWKKIPPITFLIYKKWKKSHIFSTYCYFALISNNLNLFVRLNKKKLQKEKRRMDAPDEPGHDRLEDYRKG
jgi:hypothetical protein